MLVTGLHAEDGPDGAGRDGYTTLGSREFPPLQRFLIDHVTAYNNGLYGIYAFDAQHGVIRDSYASAPPTAASTSGSAATATSSSPATSPSATRSASRTRTPPTR